jgi:hypothetical protein
MTKPAINMQYRLLRNNKESGPYTKAQLEEMGLKPYDLLWIEGRGGAWLYASEIDELKSIAPAVEEQPYDRFFKGKEKQASNTSSKQNASPIANAPTASNSATLKPPKPRFRISGDKVIMVDNAAQQQQQAATAVTTVSKIQQPAAVAEKPAVKQEIGAHIQSVGGMDWEDMYSEWKGEDKQSKERESAAPAKVQTMEEVRQRYEEAKRKQSGSNQTKGTSATKQNIMAAVAIVVLVIGGYAGYKLNNGSNNSQRSIQAAPVEKAEVVQDENNQQQNTTDASQSTTDASVANTTSAAQQAHDNTAGAQPNEIKNSLSANNSNTNTQVLPPTENKGTAANSKKEQQMNTAKNSMTNNVEKATQQPSLTEKNKANKNTIIPAKDKKEDNVQADSKGLSTTAPLQTPTDGQPATVKPVPPAKKISDYITVSKLGSNNSGSVQNVLLAVKNVTDFPIDLAVIDIQYYGANGRFQKGETMYVKNIEAGNNVNIRIPDSKTSRSITYKVSLVSSEQKTLYLVGD